MFNAKVVYLDEYRKSKQQRNLLQMIEGHLAEAGLLGKYSSAVVRRSQGREKSRPLFTMEDNGNYSK